jgi:hypothetical protein
MLDFVRAGDDAGAVRSTVAPTGRKATPCLLAAEFGTGQVFWSILWFFLFFVWIMLIFTIFGDIIRSDDMGGVGRRIWSIFIIFLPFLGIFAYLIIRQLDGRASAQGRQGPGGGDAGLHPHHRRCPEPGRRTREARRPPRQGKLDDAEYAAAKAKVLSS